MMLKLIIVALLLIPIASRASDADDAGLAQIRAAIAMQQAAAALQAATAGIQKVTPSASAATPAADAPVTASLPADIRDSLVSLAAVLIPGLIGIGLTWMRAHMKIMQDAAMDKSITDSANGFGALLVQGIKKRGMQLTDLDVHSPEVASYANSLILSHPEFTSAMKVSSDRAASVILKEAAKFPVNPDPVGVVVQASEPKPIVAAAVSQVPTPTPPIKAPSWPATPTPIPTKTA